ncbi:MAG: hypothetical protein GY749_14650 [Desulfobacteraceae bacterium]|nr:hypothetical protein [Desulfobacteraceae bacterium]
MKNEKAEIYKKPPSNAANPDLDWSQIRETVLMLNLAVAHIERTMRDGDDSVTALAEMFTSMMSNMQAISKVSESLPDNEQKVAIEKNFRDTSDKMHTAIVAFQFYDKLAQRLAHIGYSLASLGNLITDPDKLYNPRGWSGLQDLIKSKYNIDSDRKMFDAILNGATVEEALQVKLEDENDADEHDDNIELF